MDYLLLQPTAGLVKYCFGDVSLQLKKINNVL